MLLGPVQHNRDDRADSVLIMPALREDRVVSIDIGGVTLTTQSFMHALLAEPLRFLGADRIQGRVWVTGASRQVKQVARLVVGYVLDEDTE